MAYNKEPAKQFDKIFREHHNPVSKEKKRLERNREKRKSDLKKDLGID